MRIGAQAQNRPRMTPFAVEQVWHAGRPIPVADKGSTLALLVEATIRRPREQPEDQPCRRKAELGR